MPMPPRPLPQVQSLQGAVNEVIIQPQGKPATRFISMTQNGAAPNLVEVCTNLIMSSQALAYVENEIAGAVPFLLTIEDFVRYQGAAWGFTQQTIKGLMQMRCFMTAYPGFRTPDICSHKHQRL
jgi:hypothetical protein